MHMRALGGFTSERGNGRQPRHGDPSTNAGKPSLAAPFLHQIEANRIRPQSGLGWVTVLILTTAYRLC